jgi:hypothetical protein
LAATVAIVNQKSKIYSSPTKLRACEVAEEEKRDPKDKFLDALEKKKQTNAPKGHGKSGNSKVKGGQTAGGAPKIFRRKSGSS